MSSLRAIVICQKYFGNHVISSQIHLFAHLLNMKRCTLCYCYDYITITLCEDMRGDVPGILSLFIKRLGITKTSESDQNYEVRISSCFILSRCLSKQDSMWIYFIYLKFITFFTLCDSNLSHILQYYCNIFEIRLFATTLVIKGCAWWSNNGIFSFVYFLLHLSTNTL